MISLRTATPADDDTLARLSRDTFRQAYEGVHTPASIEAYCQAHFSRAQAQAALRNQDTICRFAEDAGTVAGYSRVEHHECAVLLPGGASELKQIYLLAFAYGSGAGRALFDDALASIRGAGHSWVWLHVSDINHRALAFYRKHGFERRAEGPVLEVGHDKLASSLLVREV